MFVERFRGTEYQRQFYITHCINDSSPNRVNAMLNLAKKKYPELASCHINEQFRTHGHNEFEELGIFGIGFAFDKYRDFKLLKCYEHAIDAIGLSAPMTDERRKEVVQHLYAMDKYDDMMIEEDYIRGRIRVCVKVEYYAVVVISLTEIRKSYLSQIKKCFDSISTPNLYTKCIVIVENLPFDDVMQCYEAEDIQLMSLSEVSIPRMQNIIVFEEPKPIEPKSVEPKPLTLFIPLMEPPAPTYVPVSSSLAPYYLEYYNLYSQYVPSGYSGDNGKSILTITIPGGPPIPEDDEVDDDDAELPDLKPDNALLSINHFEMIKDLD